MNRPIALLADIAQLETDMVWAEGKLSLPAARFAAWRSRLVKAPHVMQPALKTQIIAVAVKIMRVTENSPGIQGAIRQLTDLAAALREKHSRPDDGFARSVSPLGMRPVAPKIGDPAPPGTFKLSDLRPRALALNPASTRS